MREACEAAGPWRECRCGCGKSHYVDVVALCGHPSNWLAETGTLWPRQGSDLCLGCAIQLSQQAERDMARFVRRMMAGVDADYETLTRTATGGANITADPAPGW